MLKYVLVLALIGMCFGAEDDACPSGQTDDQMAATCKPETDALMAAAMAADADVTADLTAMSTMTDDGAKGCAGAKAMVDKANFKSEEVSGLFACMLKACGCTGSIYKFGFAMLFGMIAYWFKWGLEWLKLYVNLFNL